MPGEKRAQRRDIVIRLVEAQLVVWSLVSSE